MGGIIWDEWSASSQGGTELLAQQMEKRVRRSLLDRFQISLNTLVSADPEKIRILWCHLSASSADLAHLADGGWRKFHRLVFVSNWQAQTCIYRFGIPWSRCAVIQNAIEPISVGDDRFDPVPADRPIRLVYTPIPSRGLQILQVVFDKICEQRDDVELDVFSSYKIYGWDERDKQFEELYEALRRNPRVRYHGTVSNQEVRDALTSSHVLAYPATGLETSCLCLIEGMSAGLACVHPNYAALFETAANWTMMYPWHEEGRHHAVVFYHALTRAIDVVRSGSHQLRAGLAAQKQYADAVYNWDRCTARWEAFLREIADLAPAEGMAAPPADGAAT